MLNIKKYMKACEKLKDIKKDLISTYLEFSSLRKEK